jgi:hypothetical protein
MTILEAKPAETRNVLRSMLDSRALKYVKDLKELIALLVFGFTFLRAPFTSPALLGTYEYTQVLTPHTAQFAVDTINTDSAIILSTRILGLVDRILAPLNADQLLELHLKNTTTEKIADVVVRVPGAERVIDYGGKSESSRLAIDTVLRHLEVRDGQVLISIPAFPPLTSVTLQVWGDFDAGDRESIEVTASKTSVRVRPSRHASVFAVFLETYMIEISVILVTFSILVGLRRIVRNR